MRDYQRLPGRSSEEARRESGEPLEAIQLKRALAGLPYPDQKALLQPERPLLAMAVPDQAAAVQMEEEKAGLPEGIPQTPEEIKRSLGSASVAVTAKKGEVLATEGIVTLKMLAGTRLRAYATPSDIRIDASPGLVAELKYLPDTVINRLVYDFDTARFTVEAEGVGPDFLYSKAVSWAANKYYKPRLPAKIQAAGYNPKEDPDPEQTFKSLAGLFDIDLDGLPGGGGPAGKEAENFTDLSVSVGFSLRRGLKIPLLGGEAEMTVKPGTYFDLSGYLTGPVTHPQVRAITLRASSDEIEVKKIKGFAASLQGLKIRSVTILPGGKLDLDYDLVVERAAEGVVALFTLFAIAAGDRSALNARVPNVRMEKIRQELNAKISEEAGPRLIEIIRQYDKAVPGISLVKAFGL
ncbi:MAG: hypothetical protein JW797_03660 [Bradymonadales bacterium]|nr:hypothetical protein [Bradymonadales bacterium]